MIRQSVRLGDILVEKGLITEDELTEALKKQKESDYSKKLGEILVDEGFVTEREMFSKMHGLYRSGRMKRAYS